MNGFVLVEEVVSISTVHSFIHSFIPVFDPLLFSRQSKAESRESREDLTASRAAAGKNEE